MNGFRGRNGRWYHEVRSAGTAWTRGGARAVGRAARFEGCDRSEGRRARQRQGCLHVLIGGGITAVRRQRSSTRASMARGRRPVEGGCAGTAAPSRKSGINAAECRRATASDSGKSPYARTGGRPESAIAGRRSSRDSLTKTGYEVGPSDGEEVTRRGKSGGPKMPREACQELKPVRMLTARGSALKGLTRSARCETIQTISMGRSHLRWKVTGRGLVDSGKKWCSVRGG